MRWKQREFWDLLRFGSMYSKICQNIRNLNNQTDHGIEIIIAVTN